MTATQGISSPRNTRRHSRSGRARSGMPIFILHIFRVLLPVVSTALLVDCGGDDQRQTSIFTASASDFVRATYHALNSNHPEDPKTLSALLGSPLVVTETRRIQGASFNVYSIRNGDAKLARAGIDATAVQPGEDKARLLPPFVDVTVRDLTAVNCTPLSEVLASKLIEWRKNVGLASGYVAAELTGSKLTRIDIDGKPDADCIARFSLKAMNSPSN